METGKCLSVTHSSLRNAFTKSSKIYKKASLSHLNMCNYPSLKHSHTNATMHVSPRLTRTSNLPKNLCFIKTQEASNKLIFFWFLVIAVRVSQIAKSNNPENNSMLRESARVPHAGISREKSNSSPFQKHLKYSMILDDFSRRSFGTMSPPSVINSFKPIFIVFEEIFFQILTINVYGL